MVACASLRFVRDDVKSPGGWMLEGTNDTTRTDCYIELSPALDFSMC